MNLLMPLLFSGLLLAACSANQVDVTRVTSFPQEQTATLPSGITPTPSLLDPTATWPPETTITLSQDGGIAGIHQEWTMSTDGWLILPNSERIEISPDIVWDLAYSIEDSGIFNLEQGAPKAVCCDFFSYTLELQQGDQYHVLSYSEGDEEAPSEFWDVVNSFEKMVANSE